MLLGGFSPPQQPEQPVVDVSQGGDVLGERPDSIELQGVIVMLLNVARIWTPLSAL